MVTHNFGQYIFGVNAPAAQASCEVMCCNSCVLGMFEASIDSLLRFVDVRGESHLRVPTSEGTPLQKPEATWRSRKQKK